MTKRERFMAFLENKPVDRVPVAMFHHFCAAPDFNQGTVNDAAFERNIEGHRIARETFDPDVAKVMTDTLMLVPLDCSFVKTASDLRYVEPPAKDSLFVKKTIELTKRVRDIYADSDVPVYGTSFSPYTVLRFSLSPKGMLGNGQDEALFKRLLEEDIDAVSNALGVINEFICDLNDAMFRECGIDGIYLSVNNQLGIVPLELHKKYVAPHEKLILEHAKKFSSINLLHICGGPLAVPSTLEPFKDYDVAAFNWAVEAEHISLKEGKEILGGKPVFGGFERTGLIDKGSREEIEKRVYDILDECGQVGIMIGDDCTVPTDIDDNRLEWVRQAAIRYAAEH